VRLSAGLGRLLRPGAGSARARGTRAAWARLGRGRGEGSARLGLGLGPGPGVSVRVSVLGRISWPGPGAPAESVRALRPRAVRHAYRCSYADGRTGDLGGRRQLVRRSAGVPLAALPVIARGATGGPLGRAGVSVAVHGWVSGCYGRLWPWVSGALSGRRLTVQSSQACRQEGGAALFPDRPVLPRGFVSRGPPNLGGALGPAPRCETARLANSRSGTVHSRRCKSGLGGWAPGARDSNPTDPLGRPEAPVPRVVTWSVRSAGSAQAGGVGGQRGLGPVWAQGLWGQGGQRGLGPVWAQGLWG